MNDEYDHKNYDCIKGIDHPKITILSSLVALMPF